MWSNHLKADQDKREAAERVHDFHADSCPIARTIKECVDISTELQFEQSGINQCPKLNLKKGDLNAVYTS